MRFNIWIARYFSGVLQVKKQLLTIDAKRRSCELVVNERLLCRNIAVYNLTGEIYSRQTQSGSLPANDTSARK